MNLDISHKVELKKFIYQEMIDKSESAAPGFLILALWFCYLSRNLDSDYEKIQFGLSLFLSTLALIRLFIKRISSKFKLELHRTAHFLRYTVIVNGFAWSLLFCNGLVGVGFQDFGMVLAISCAAVGLAIGSVLSISYSLKMAWAFQFIVLGGPLGISIWYSFYKSIHSAEVTAFIMGIAIIYLVKQTLDFNRHFIFRIETQIKLQKTNELLNASQIQLIEETTKRQESIRLASLGEMAGGISHEINNPLAVILANFEISKKLMNNPNAQPAEFKLLFERIGKNAERISKIIKSMKSLSRDGSSDPFELTKLDSIFANIQTLFKERFESNNIKLDFIFFPEFEFECRQVQIEQIVVNLLNNSFDAIRNLSEKWVKIEAFEQGADLVFKITDSGLGISQDVQKKLMHPFFTTKGPGVGTGLGLSISMNLAKEHRGSLMYDPSSKNTRFELKIPLRQSSSDETQKKLQAS